MSPRFGYTPVVPPFAGAGQSEAVVASYAATLGRLGGARREPEGYDDPAPLVLLVATGGTEGVIIERHSERQDRVPGEPAILVAHPGNNSLPASLEALARLHQDGYPGRIVYLETPEDPAGLAALSEALRDVEVRRTLRATRIGVVGSPSDWLVASTPDTETVRAVWGPEIVPIDLAEVTDALVAVPESAVSAAAAGLIGGATDVREPTAEDVSDVARVYAALDSVVRAHGLGALTVRCFDLVLDRSTTGCFALSELTDRGVIAGCEGDVVSTIGLLWARELTGQVPWMANPASVDVDRNSLVLAHCTVPRGLVQRYRLRSHFESGQGVGIQGELRCGSVTLLRIGGTLMDELWLAEGEITASGDAENLCRTQAHITLGTGHVSELLDHPLGNHIVLIRGHHAERLRRWWETML